METQLNSNDDPRGMPADATHEECLVIGGWFQISAAHRMIARLPEGKTGRQALYEAEMRQHPGLDGDALQAKKRRTLEWVNRMGEAAAADYFLRVHADRYEGLVRELPAAEWHRFKKAGGRPAR